MALDEGFTSLSYGLPFVLFFSASPLASFRREAALSSSRALGLFSAVEGLPSLLFLDAPLVRGAATGFAWDFCWSARCCQIFTAGKGASLRGLGGSFSFSASFLSLFSFFSPFFPFLPFSLLSGFSEVFCTGSTLLSTEVEACDLLSHVDSDEVLGCEDASSSLVTVEADRESRSVVDASSDSAAFAGFEVVVWDSPFVVGCSIEDSVSASSAQLFTWAIRSEGRRVGKGA